MAGIHAGSSSEEKGGREKGAHQKGGGGRSSSSLKGTTQSYNACTSKAPQMTRARGDHMLTYVPTTGPPVPFVFSHPQLKEAFESTPTFSFFFFLFFYLFCDELDTQCCD